jgi:phosphate transport system permease protein
MSSTSAAPPFEAAAVFESRPDDIARAPSRRQMLVDRVFRLACAIFAWATVALVAFIVLRIAVAALPAVRRYGLGFLSGRVWDPNTERYGILAEIWGTMYTSVLALGLGTAFGLAVAIFLSEGYLGQAAFALLRLVNLQLHPCGRNCLINSSTC